MLFQQCSGVYPELIWREKVSVLASPATVDVLCSHAMHSLPVCKASGEP